MTTWRIGTAVVDGEPRIVIEHAGGCGRLDALVADAPADVRSLIEGGDRWTDAIDAALAAGTGPAVDVPGDPCWAPPLMPAKLICIGANYAEHNAEMLGEVQNSVPYAFLKPPTTTLIGSGRAAPLPAHAQEIDYEAELAVVIGRPARNVPRERAREHVFGYAVLNDISARDWVRSPTVLGLDWVMSKGFDASAPMGPFITPARFAGDPDDLAIRLWVNDELRQDSRTSQMVFDVAGLVSHLSGVMTLEPGDVIATGTPSGVGMGRTPPAWLRAGDVVRVEVEGLGTLTTPVVAAVAEPVPPTELLHSART
jgi:2,4-didehydro-3-deoxy-L-rhamnonate hydrolase